MNINNGLELAAQSIAADIVSILEISEAKANKLNITPTAFLAEDGIKHITEAFTLAILALEFSPLHKVHLLELLKEMELDSFNKTYPLWELTLVLIKEIKYRNNCRNKAI